MWILGNKYPEEFWTLVVGKVVVTVASCAVDEST